MNATIKDVADLAGVSDTAVSLAFRENSRISDATRKKVLKAASKLKYTPNIVAQNLRGGKTRTIGFIVNDIANPFYSLMLKVAEKELEKTGYAMLTASSDWDEKREKSLVERMLQMRVQGLIICLCEKGRSGINLIRKYDLPHIAVDSFPEYYNGAYIANDFIDCGKIVAEHLYQIGCRKPGIINAEKKMTEFSAFKKIISSFKNTFKSKGIKIPSKNIINAGLSVDAGKKAFEIYKNKNISVDAFFCMNDLCALGFMENAEIAGIETGEELALVGIDDIDISSFSRISLTSVQQPYAEIAKNAVIALIENIKNPNSKIMKKELLPKLMIRNSTLLFKK